MPALIQFVMSNNAFNVKARFIYQAEIFYVSTLYVFCYMKAKLTSLILYFLFFISLFYMPWGYSVYTITIIENEFFSENSVNEPSKRQSSNKIEVDIKKRVLSILSWDEVFYQKDEEERHCLSTYFNQVLLGCTGCCNDACTDIALETILNAMSSTHVEAEKEMGLFKVSFVKGKNVDQVSPFASLEHGNSMHEVGCRSQKINFSNSLYISNKLLSKHLSSSHLFNGEIYHESKVFKLKKKLMDKLLNGNNINADDLSNGVWSPIVLDEIQGRSEENVMLCFSFVAISLPEVTCDFIMKYLGDEDEKSPSGVYSVESDESQCIKGRKTLPVYIFKKNSSSYLKDITNIKELILMVAQMLEAEVNNMACTMADIEKVVKDKLQKLNTSRNEFYIKRMSDRQMYRIWDSKNKRTFDYDEKSNQYEIMTSWYGMFQISLIDDNNTLVREPIYIVTEESYEFAQRQPKSFVSASHKIFCATGYTLNGVYTERIKGNEFYEQILSMQDRQLLENGEANLTKKPQMNGDMLIRYIPLFESKRVDYWELPVSDLYLDRFDLQITRSFHGNPVEEKKDLTMRKTQCFHETKKTIETFFPFLVHRKPNEKTMCDEKQKDCQLLYKQLRGVVDNFKVKPPINFDNITLSHLLNTLDCNKFLSTKSYHQTNGEIKLKRIYQLILHKLGAGVKRREDKMYKVDVIFGPDYHFILNSKACIDELESISDCIKNHKGLYFLDFEKFKDLLSLSSSNISDEQKANVWPSMNAGVECLQCSDEFNLFMRCIPLKENYKLSRENEHLYQSLGLDDLMQRAAFNVKLENESTDVLKYFYSIKNSPMNINVDSTSEELELTFVTGGTTRKKGTANFAQQELIKELVLQIIEEEETGKKDKSFRLFLRDEQNHRHAKAIGEFISFAVNQGLYLCSNKGLILRTKCCKKEIIFTSKFTNYFLGIIAMIDIRKKEEFKHKKIIPEFHVQDCTEFLRRRDKERNEN